MARTTTLAAAAPVFAALGDPTRLAIISRLCLEGPLPIVSLTERAKVTRQAVTKHLEALAEVGLVRSSRDGRERIWTLEPGGLVAASRYLDQISRRWDDRIERLRAFVETDD
ncbi:MAG TPA: metalloregulator ArsR/SmtB family transcription factor [Kofleriaceae bacterium]|nr:metalloregulator ArsR/SmtB family transcription factor [Kofleriaceae bacterium]